MADIDEGGSYLFAQSHLFQAILAIFSGIDLSDIAQQFNQRIDCQRSRSSLLSQPISGFGLLLRLTRLQHRNMARQFVVQAALRVRGALGAKSRQQKQNQSQADTETYLSEFTHGPAPLHSVGTLTGSNSTIHQL